MRVAHLPSERQYSTVIQVNRGSTLALRRSTFDLCPSEQRSLRAARRSNRTEVTREPVRVAHLQGYLAHKKPPPPKDHHRTLGMVLLYGARRVVSLMSEVPLYHARSPPTTREGVFH